MKIKINETNREAITAALAAANGKATFWSAPASVAALDNSSWHIIALRKNMFQAGHFALTGWGDALDARVNQLPTGRTVGRALRAFRRKLQRVPVVFASA